MKQVQDALQSLLRFESRPGVLPFQPYSLQPRHAVVPYPDSLGMALPHDQCSLLGPTFPQWPSHGSTGAYQRPPPAHAWDTAAAQLQCWLGSLLASSSQPPERMLPHASVYPPRQPPVVETPTGCWPGLSLSHEGFPVGQPFQQQACNSLPQHAWPTGSNGVEDWTMRVVCAALQRLLLSAPARPATLQAERAASPYHLSGRLLLLLLLSRNRLSELVGSLAECVRRISL